MVILGWKIALTLVKVEKKFYLVIDGIVLQKPLDMKTGIGVLTSSRERALVKSLTSTGVVLELNEERYTLDKSLLDQLRESKVIYLIQGRKIVEIVITQKSSSHELIRAIIFSPQSVELGEIFYGESFYVEKGKPEALEYAREFLMVL